MREGRCVDWREAHRALQAIVLRKAELDVEEASALLDAREARVHVELGYGSFGEYLERMLGYSARTVREKLRVAEELEALPAIRGALGSGELSYSAVREITRCAEPENEAQWLEAAKNK